MNAGGEIFKWTGGWTWTGIPGRLKQISVGSSGQIWGVSSNGDVYRWTGNNWDRVDGNLKWVAIGKDGAVWGVNSADNIFRR